MQNAPREAPAAQYGRKFTCNVRPGELPRRVLGVSLLAKCVPGGSQTRPGGSRNAICTKIHLKNAPREAPKIGFACNFLGSGFNAARGAPKYVLHVNSRAKCAGGSKNAFCALTHTHNVARGFHPCVFHVNSHANMRPGRLQTYVLHVESNA